MKTIVAATGLLLGILNYANAAEPVCYFVSVHLFRLSAPATGKMESASVTLINSDAGGGPSQSTRFSSFSAADLTIGKNVFHMDAKGWTWNGANGKLGDGVECLSRPQIAIEAGQSARVEVGADFPVEYMERTAEGHFVQKVQQYSGGETTDLVVNKDASGNIIVAPLEIQIISWKGKRGPVEGSALDIGKPVLDKARISMAVTCKPRQPVGIMWTPGRPAASTQAAIHPSIVPEAPADGGLLMILAVTEAEAQPPKTESKSPQ